MLETPAQLKSVSSPQGRQAPREFEPGSSSRNMREIDSGMGNSKKRPPSSLSEASYHPRNRDLFEDQPQNNIDISIPSHRNRIDGPETWLGLSLFSNHLKTNNKRHKSSWAPGMMADDFTGWIFPNEISEKSSLSDRASRIEQAPPSPELIQSVTQELRVENQAPVTPVPTNTNSPPEASTSSPSLGRNTLNEIEPYVPEKDDEHFDLFDAKYGEIKRAKEPTDDLARKITTSAYYDRSDKMWLWIFVNTVYRAEPHEQLYRSTYGSTIAKFNDLFAADVGKFLNQGRDGIALDKIRSREFYEIILQFSDIFWVNNLRLLGSLGVSEEAELLKQHASIYRWLLCCNEHDLIPALEPFKLVITMKQSDEKVYRIMKRKNKFTVDIGSVSERQGFLTEAAIILLATYYKTVNLEKWEVVFENDFNFVSHMSKTATESFYSATRIARREMHHLQLFPWENACDLSSTYAVLRKVQFTKPCGVDFKRYINEIDLPRSEVKEEDEEIGAIPLDLPETGKIDCEQDMKTGIWARWGHISMIATNLQSRRLEEPLRVDSTGIMVEIKKFKMRQGKKKLHFAHKTISERGFVGRAGRLLEVLLALNQRLMETLGHPLTTSIDLEEQNKVQLFFLHLITSSPASLSIDPKINEQIDLGKIAFIQVSLFKAIECRSTEKVYKLYDRAPRLSRQNLIMCEVAVKTLAYYYRRESYIKWINVFEDEAKFFKSFEKIAKRIKTNSDYSRFSRDSFPEMRKAKMIPWRNPVIITNRQKVTITRLFKIDHYAQLKLKKKDKT
ncbi:hypothetical protein PGT21_024316 [Puccinia graminis f. sp. tritici]|nr:hypothetical protein PGT21_024316 [Puccinia graminis f. sp. tritici]